MQRILAMLNESSEDAPPYSASNIHRMLEQAVQCGREGFESVKPPSKQQVHRTLKELWYAGIIVASRHKEDRYGNLPGWVVRYELAEGMFERVLESRIADLHRRVERALHGVTIGMFGAKPFDQGATPEAAEAMRAELALLLTRADDPRLRACQSALDAGLPLPDGYLPADAKGLPAILQKNHPGKGGRRALFENGDNRPPLPLTLRI